MSGWYGGFHFAKRSDVTRKLKEWMSPEPCWWLPTAAVLRFERCLLLLRVATAACLRCCLLLPAGCCCCLLLLALRPAAATCDARCDARTDVPYARGSRRR
eukprot:COSAG01_NODE_153_length_23909_cov_32.542018_4_plen_101_part_00